MKTRSMSHSVFGPALLLALLAASALAVRALALPAPALVAGLTLVALGLRIGVMYSAVAEPSEAPARPIGPGAHGREPALHGAKG